MSGSSNSGSPGANGGSSESSLREEAARRVFDDYVHRLKGLVRYILQERIRNKEGTSAIVQSALASFFRADPDLRDTESLWPLLAIITKRKAIDKVKRFTTAARDINREHSAANDDRERSAIPPWDLQVLAAGPTPDEAAAFIDLIESLPEDDIKLVQYRLDGYTYAEIIQKISEASGKPCSEKTLQRRFGKIRKRLEAALDE